MKIKNCYFPLFVSSGVLQKEKDHIEGFAPEVRLLLAFAHERELCSCVCEYVGNVCIDLQLHEFFVVSISFVPNFP